LESRNQLNFGISPSLSAISEPGNVERNLETSEISESFNEWNLRIFNEWNLGTFQRVKSLNLSTSEILESRNEQNFGISEHAKSQNLGIGKFLEPRAKTCKIIVYLLFMLTSLFAGCIL
jgi:hypothetical protein